jgi:FkbM family methyltransferase
MLAALRLLIHRRLPLLGRAYHRFRERAWQKVPAAVGNFRIFVPPAMLDRAPTERATFIREAKFADVCVDVGANVGLYTCLAASLSKPTIAIEPLPENLAVLYRNLALNSFKHVEVLPVGLSDQAGISEICGYGDMASFVPGWSAGSASRHQLVPTSTLDILLAGRFQGKRLFIKVDVEGFEEVLLAGAVATLARTPKPVWLVEILPTSGLRSFETFCRFGYKSTPIEAGSFLFVESISS